MPNPQQILENLDFVRESIAPETDWVSILSGQESKKLFEEEERAGLLQQEFHNLLIYGIRISFAIVTVVLFIRIAHLVLPKKWMWLEADDLQSLDKFFFSGTLGGIISKNLNKVIRIKN